MTTHPTEQWAGDRGRCDSWVGCICTIVQRYFYRIVATSVTESMHGTSACLTRAGPVLRNFRGRPGVGTGRWVGRAFRGRPGVGPG